MAAVLDAFASKLAEILAGMAKEEVEMLLGVPGEITKLETTLGDLSSILADAERRRIRDSAVERWVRELKDVMYDADDILDLCQIMEGGEGPSSSAAAPKTTPGCCNISRMLFCFRNPVVAHEIGRKIQAVNQRLVALEKRSSRFGFITQAINSSGHYANKSTNPWSDGNRNTGPAFIQSEIVGEKVEESKKQLIDLLIKKVGTHTGSSGSNNVAVAAAITGAGGIGKTTLARMVFNDATLVESFDKTVWLSINKEVNEIALLHRAIAAFGGDYGGLAADKALLEHALKQVVRQKKFLLVMDDVWSDKVWNELLRVPLNDGASGSQVLVTTRNDGVARMMKAQYLHRVDKLETQDAWALLKKQLVLNESDEADVDGLKDNGIRIVEKCDGLPLAVKVLGGLLLNTSRTRDAWVDVSNHVTWSMEGMDDDINKAVYLSYEELPSHLKQCFLFCSLFPKDELLSFGVISQLWIAEGYTDNKLSSKLPEDLALEYYKELISRNLLEPDKRSYDQLGCTMHDVVRSFAQYITKDEAVLITEGQDVRRTIGGTSKLRHLSISRRPVEWDALKSQTSLRTLMLFRSTTTVEPKDLMNNISGLRVLYLDNENPVELPDSICRLKHLRYLCLSRTSISMIPQGIGDLKFLQALELRGCTNFSQLPNSILKLRKLRSLNFSDTAITSVPRGFGKLEDLVRLMGFPTHSGDSTDVWCSLEELGPLSKLKVLGIRDLEKATSGSTAAKAMLTSKHHLTNLYLIFTSKLGKNGEVEDDIGEEEHERTEEVLANLCPPTCTEILDIRGYFARGLPQWMRTMSAFGSLRRLALGDYACCTQLPNGLGQLPFLDYFWVDRAPSVQCVRHDFLHPSLGGEADGKDKGPRLPGTRNNNPRQPHRISRGAGVAFPKLTRLGFQGMLEWTEWEWEQHVPAMPALEALVINNCKLQRLPAGLAQHASRLRKFDLTYAQHLISVENFPSLVNLWLYGNPRLERISNNPSLQFIDISNCPALKEMDGLPSLRSLEWWDLGAEALPQYLREANLKKLRVDCSRSLLKLIALQDESSEWGKIKHVQQLKAYGHKTEEEEPDQSSQEDEEANEEEANQLEEDEVEEDTIQSEEEEDADEEKNNQSEEDEEAEWYIYYTKEPYSFNAYLGESTGITQECKE